MFADGTSRRVLAAAARVVALTSLACGDPGGSGTAGESGGDTGADPVNAWAIDLENVYAVEARTYHTLAVTPNGQTLLAGHFDGPLDLGDGPVEPIGMDGFLVALSADGVPVWERHWTAGPNDHVFCLGLAADGQGNATLIGELAEAVDLGAGAIGPGMFAASFAPGGELRWAQLVGTNIILSDVAVAEDGALVIVGTSGGGYVLGMDTGADDAGDAFALRLDDLGQLVWLQSIGGEGQQSGSFGAFAPDGSVLVTGATNQALSLAGTSVPGDFVAKLDASGSLQWGRALELPAAGVVADSQGRIVVASSTGNNSALLGLDPAGDMTWSHAIHGDLTGSIVDIVVDRNDEVIVTGDVANNLKIDEAQFGEPGSGPYLLGLDSGGAPRWLAVLEGEARAQALAVTKDGALVLKGSFVKELDLGAGKLVAEPNQGDVFVAGFTR